MTRRLSTKPCQSWKLEGRELAVATRIGIPVIGSFPNGRDHLAVETLA
jgi:hypothetical protein